MHKTHTRPLNKHILYIFFFLTIRAVHLRPLPHTRLHSKMTRYTEYKPYELRLSGNDVRIVYTDFVDTFDTTQILFYSTERVCSRQKNEREKSRFNCIIIA